MMHTKNTLTCDTSEQLTSAINYSMNKELNRLASFALWPTNNRAELPRKLWKAGFYYSGQSGDDEVTCFSCKVKLAGWQERSSPYEEHRRASPRCPLINNADSSNNKPLTATTEACRALAEITNRYNSSDQVPRQQNQHNTQTSTATEEGLGSSTAVAHASRTARNNGGAYTSLSQIQQGLSPVSLPASHVRTPVQGRSGGVDVRSCSRVTERDTILNSSKARARVDPHSASSTRTVAKTHCKRPETSSTEHELSNTVVERTDSPLGQPRHPQYTLLSARLESFSRWPNNKSQTPAEMAEAGFFSVGKDDYVRCYFCHGGLHNWLPGDSSWVEHARWFPKCEFVKRVKGLHFMQGVKMGLNKELVTSATLIADEIHQETKPTDINQPSAQSTQYKPESHIGDPVSVLDRLRKERNAIAEANQRLREAGLCRVCKTEETCILFLPCGHLATCEKCGEIEVYCPQCGQIVQGTVRTYTA